MRFKTGAFVAHEQKVTIKTGKKKLSFGFTENSCDGNSAWHAAAHFVY